MDLDFVEENTAVLLRRWHHLRNSGAQGPEWQAFGFDSDQAVELVDLEEIQVKRCADAAIPLFRVGVPDGRLAQLLDPSTPELPPMTPAEQIIVEENAILLHNRRAATAGGGRYGAIVYGLSHAAAEMLGKATYQQIQSACRKGARIAQFAPRRGYLRTAAMNFHLTQRQRTALAVSASTLMETVL